MTPSGGAERSLADTWGRALVVVAHPDDEVLGCGATLARLANEGATTHVLVLGEGYTGRFDTREQADAEGIDHLRKAARQACDRLGVAEVRFGDLPDHRFDSVDLLDIIKQIEGVIAEVRPDVVFCHHPGDVNIDHRKTTEAVLSATRPKPGTAIRDVLTFEIASSTEWAFASLQPFTPSVFVDVSPTIEAKIEAIACYESEAAPFPHPRSPEALRAQLTRWGSAVGVEAAEAFQPIRLIR